MNMKKWSTEYSECIECKTNEKRYGGKGLCSTCYSRYQYKINPKRKEYQKIATYKWKDKYPERWREIQKKATDKYRNKSKVVDN